MTDVKQVKDIITLKDMGIDDLVEEILAGVGQLIDIKNKTAEDVFTVNFFVGQNTVNHPAYKKGQEGQGELFEAIVKGIKQKNNRVNVSVPWLRLCIDIFEWSGQDLDGAHKLFEQHQLEPSVSNAKLLMSGKTSRPKRITCECPVCGRIHERLNEKKLD